MEINANLRMEEHESEYVHGNQCKSRVEVLSPDTCEGGAYLGAGRSPGPHDCLATGSHWQRLHSSTLGHARSNPRILVSESRRCKIHTIFFFRENS